jgi:hypothetical protein
MEPPNELIYFGLLQIRSAQKISPDCEGPF